ncbi:MAG TPA: acetyl-CoA hydrolase/transferase C-terminal domain-containing protein [Acidobacteriota bacterium]|nr:acetyl-CoA hydrolase/transferase C-terminal domain-containing protein [Acidobacteriota bacterium]
MATTTPVAGKRTGRGMSWVDSYRSKCCSADEAARVIRSEACVHIHPGCAEPEQLVKAMVRRAGELRNVKVIHILTTGSADYVLPEMEGRFRHVAFFAGANVRTAINEGRADFIPIFLSEVEALMVNGIIPIDVALIHVSPPDEHGFCSFGVGVDTTKTAAEQARVVIAQVNPKMPRTLGDSFIHLNKIQHIVEVTDDILEHPQGQVSDVAKRIGRNIADLIDDGSTLQLGIGEIPDAVLGYLADKKHLGIHTEMVSDGVIDLIEKGVITNEKKTIHPGKIILGFVLGTRRLYDFIDNNPIFEFHPSQYTNDPFIISRNDRQVAINSAIEVDLTGQVCSDSIGCSLYSGIGGQVDFIRGSARSRGGKPIIALPSTAKEESISRITPCLKQFAGVVTSRGDVHYVITEYGTAYLHGKTIRERCQVLIKIAHPKFRDELASAARQRNLI